MADLERKIIAKGFKFRCIFVVVVNLNNKDSKHSVDS